MNVPESKEVIIQRIAEDPQVIDFLIRVMSFGDIGPNIVTAEFQLAADVAEKYGATYDDMLLAGDIARARIDEDILSGKLNIL